jgi:protein-S-isoprenylcysteine O-methyltransferase Ste14
MARFDVPQLGARGGGWVVIQFVLMPAAIVVGLVAQGWPHDAAGILKGLGAILAFAGGVVIFLAAQTLGSSLTPYPRPVAHGQVTDAGPYRFVRHPIYAGGILFFVGYGLAFSPWALAVAVVLAVVWGLKAIVEERFLVAQYPGYAEYMTRVPYRLVPFVY